MVQVTIRTEEKKFKKFKIHGFKVKPWEKEVRLDFTKGEEVLHAICDEMQERGIETGKIHITIYFDDKEIECSPMILDITEEYPLLVNLIKQDMIQSMDENTTEEETKLLRSVLESIQQEVGVISDDSTPIEEEDERIEQVDQEAEQSNEVSIDVNTYEDQENSDEGIDEELEIVIDEENEKNSVNSVDTQDQSKGRLTTSYMAYTTPTNRLNHLSEVADSCSEEAVFNSFELQELNELTELQKYQYNYLTKRLDELGLKTNVKAFKSVIDETKVNVTKQLSEYYKEVNQDKPSKYADEHIEEEFAEVKLTFNQKYFDFEAQQEAIMERFVKDMEESKQKELEAFKTQLEQKYAKHLQEERQKTEAALVTKKETLRKDLEQEEAVVYQALITEKMEERDQKLTDYKNQLEEQAQSDIEMASLNLMSTFEEIKSTLQKELEEKSVEWQQLIVQEEQLQEQRREEANRKKEKEQEQRMKEKELELKEKDLSLKQKELDTPKTPEIHVMSMPATEPKNVFNDQVLQQLLADRKKEADQKQARFKYGMIALVTCTMLGVGGYLFNSTNNTQAELNRTKEQLSAVMKKAEEKPEETKETLDTLLKDREFEKAFDKYTDAKSLEKMENYFVETEDLPMLKKFNQAFKTKTGTLNEAILESNNKKITESYEKIEKKDQLNDQQKNAVKLAYYSQNKKDLAEKV
ncbi:hypothetical protein ACIJDX_002569 [Enterococcus faecalis]|uniref:hypothetical protein n=1 Tax=Enterococcus faecalis TaxID=1351 RepID=UPI0023A9E403|nr:hypothetical protein [Enterococcus faecalis]WEB08050.1 hypothetical protein PUW76_12840 [Enterococcus faecalis]